MAPDSTCNGTPMNVTLIKLYSSPYRPRGSERWDTVSPALPRWYPGDMAAPLTRGIRYYVARDLDRDPELCDSTLTVEKHRTQWRERILFRCKLERGHQEAHRERLFRWDDDGYVQRMETP